MCQNKNLVDIYLREMLTALIMEKRSLKIDWVLIHLHLIWLNTLLSSSKVIFCLSDKTFCLLIATGSRHVYDYFLFSNCNTLAAVESGNDITPASSSGQTPSPLITPTDENNCSNDAQISGKRAKWFCDSQMNTLMFSTVSPYVISRSNPLISPYYAPNLFHVWDMYQYQYKYEIIVIIVKCVCSFTFFTFSFFLSFFLSFFTYSFLYCFNTHLK